MAVPQNISLAEAPSSPPAAAAAQGIPATMLDTLAARFREGGLFLAVLDQHGKVNHFDAAAPSFFTRFVLSALRSPGAAHTAFITAVQSVAPASNIATWDFLPGTVAAAFPFVDKRQVTGIVLLAGKREGFSLSEEVLRDAGRFGLDAGWLGQQAGLLPSFSEANVVSAAKLLAAMSRDQARLAAFEQEIDSLSTQLSNSYEEISLI